MESTNNENWLILTIHFTVDVYELYDTETSLTYWLILV